MPNIKNKYWPICINSKKNNCRYKYMEQLLSKLESFPQHILYIKRNGSLAVSFA
ncbi:hypothetical protein D3C73_514570 [compost metagenome]